MPRDIRIEELRSTIVIGWRTSEDGLLLRVPGETYEIRPVCTCGRSHWIVHESPVGGLATLVLVCHHCGNRASLAIDAIRSTA